jgi:hypothetical protein
MHRIVAAEASNERSSVQNADTVSREIVHQFSLLRKAELDQTMAGPAMRRA